MKLILLSALLITAGQASRSEKCSSEKCCWVDIPDGYCGSSKLKDPPANISTEFYIRNLEEVNEAKLSFTMSL